MVEAVNSIRNMLIEHERIHNEGLMVYFDDFGESSLNIFVYCFTKTAVWSEYLEIRQDVNLKIMEIFENLILNLLFLLCQFILKMRILLCLKFILV
jgi:MscS family membrane protein